MLIRPFLASDIEPCVQIITECLGKDNGLMSAKDMRDGLSWPNPEYQWCERVVAEQAGALVGICGAYRLATHPSGYSGVCWYGVVPKERNKWIGAALLSKSERLALEHGLTYMFAWTIDSAVGYYRSKGYQDLSPETIVPKESSLLVGKDLAACQSSSS